jgi:tetratricopeptide (TPR) repeat protein
MNRFIEPVFWSGIAALALGPFAASQAQRSLQDDSALQQHYTTAQRFQQAGKNDEAAGEYRAFLVEAQGELAAGYIASGDFARAETLAKAVLSNAAADPHLASEAHQILGRVLLKQNQDREAKAEFEKAVDLDPSFASRYDLAVACLDLDDDKCASQAFDEIESSFSDTPALHMQIGLAYGNSDFIPKAIVEFQKAIAEDPRFPHAHYCLAASLLASGDDQKNIPEAEAELKKELEISPRDALTYAALGKLAVADHRTADAESYLKKATLLDPQNPDAFLYLGQLYSDTGRIADAEAALRKSIALTTDPSRNRFQIQKTHFLLGRVLMQEHRPAEAHAEMDLSRKFADRDLSHDKGELAGLLHDSSVPNAADAATSPANTASPANAAALHAFEQRLAPAIADSYNDLGVIAATASQYSEAFADFNHAAEWNPALDGLDLNRGRAAFMASRFADAIQPLSHYVDAHPGDSGVRGALAMSQFMTHDYSGCLQTLKAVPGEGNDAQLASIPQLAYIIADSLVQTGQTTEGTQRLESLESAHPEIAEVHRALGEVYAAGHNRQKAAEELHTALVLNNSDAQAHYDLGRLTLESGSAAAAIPELEAATRLAPNDPAFHRELAHAYGLVSRKEDAQREAGISEKLASAARTEQPGTSNGSIH